MKLSSRTSKRFLEVVRRLDQLGFASSLFCGLHCAVTPLLLGLFLSLGTEKLIKGWENINLICLLISPFVAFFSLKEGFAHHQSSLPAKVFLFGFIALVTGYSLDSFSESWHIFLMVLGGFTIAYAHLLNLRLLMSAHDHPSNVRQ